MNEQRKIVFYRTYDGKCPVEEFLDSLPGKVANKITWVLRIIRELDRIPEIYFKKLIGTDEIWECRIRLGSNVYRLLGFFAGHATLVLTNGFLKNSDKTPRKETHMAELSRREYFIRRMNHGRP